MSGTNPGGWGGNMGRVGIVSPLPVVPGFRMHVEEGRGRGALSVFLLVPDHDANALSNALAVLHDPRGPADLDARLGELAAISPRGTSFLVALEQHVWVFPSNEAHVRLLRGGEAEGIDVPQVVKLAADDRLEVVAARTGEAVALASFAEVMQPSPAVAPESIPSLADRVRNTADRARATLRSAIDRTRAPSRGTFPRFAALLAGCAALAVFAWFRVDASKVRSDPPRSARSEARVEPNLEERVLGIVSGASNEPRQENVTPPSETAATPAASDASSEGAGKVSGANEVPRNPGPAPKEWTFQARAAITSSPLVVGGVVVFGSRDSTVYCLDAETGATKWSLPAGSGVGSSPRVARGLVVFGTYAGRVIAADVKTGEIKWQGRTGGKIVANPCLLDDLVVIGSSDRRVHAFQLDDGEKTWAVETKGALRATAEAVGADRVVVGSSDGTIYAIDVVKGRVVWTRAAGAGVVGSAAYDEDGDRVLIGAQDGTVLCLAAKDGAVVWKANVGAGVNARPRIADGVALVGTTKGTLFALDRKDGSVRWSLKGQKGFDATPTIVHETVVAATQGGTVLFVGLDQGDVRGQRSLGSRIWSSPATSNEIVYVGTFDGTFHALALP